MQTITIHTGRSKGIINKNIYGHFSEHLGRCIYQGIFVGQDSAIPNVRGMRVDVVEAMKRICVPVLRWPGGCFADEYHWRDGIGPREARKRMVNTHWGGVVEDNSFGTHEFLDLCEQVGCAPYVNANLGSGTVQEMSEWVEYVNSPSDSSVVKERWANGRKDPFGVKFWGVGNENWGCGGHMRPSYYADEYRRYQTYCRAYGEHVPYKIACGPNGGDYEWTETLMKIAGQHMHALTLHHYTVTGTWQDKGSATRFAEAEYYTTLQKALYMDTLVENHLQIMNRYDPDHRVDLIVDEWGTWHDVEPGTNPGFLYQQNTMRDAMVAALTLNIFNRHCDRVSMANIAQIVNVLQAIILTEGEKMILTPTYHVFDLYKAHQDAREVDCFTQTDETYPGVPRISASASEKDGALTITLANTAMDQEAKALVVGDIAGMEVTGCVLHGDKAAHNTFESAPVEIKPFDGFAWTERGLSVTLPACGIVALTLRKMAL